VILKIPQTLYPSMVDRCKGKGRLTPCVICGEDRVVDSAHFPSPKSVGGEKTIPLCPTHHNLLDEGRISLWELETIWKKEFHDQARTFEEFMTWANREGYPYTADNLKRKKIYAEEHSTTR